jgi:hypothetical protein
MTNANAAYAAMYRKQIGEAQASILEMWEIIKAEGETEDRLQELNDLYQDLHGAEANLKAVK